MIRIISPSIDADDKQAVCEVLDSGFLVQGKRVHEFESMLMDYTGAQHVIAVSSATAALQISLRAIGVERDDIVVVAAYSFTATANVIELCGAIPVFVDIEEPTFGMDPQKFSETLDRLMQDPQTKDRVKAIMPVHIAGQLANIEEICKIAERYHIPVIEDAACALSARANGKSAGTFGVIGCLSFHPRKAITTGEGGAILTNDAGIDRMSRAFRNHGIDPCADKTDFICAGFNYRMTDMQGALGVSQMRKLDRIQNARMEGAKRYQTLLQDSPFVLPRISERHCFQSYTINLPDSMAANRDAIIAGAREQGVEMVIGTWHMPMCRYYREKYGYHVGDFPVSDRVFQNSITLPLYLGLTKQEQMQVVDTLLALCKLA